MFLKVKKILGRIAAIVLVVAWFARGFLEYNYFDYPLTPDPQEGKIVPYAVKGVVVYITQSQQNLLSWLIWVIIGSGLICALVILIHGGDPLKSKE